MKVVELIIEGNLSREDENKVRSLANIKYKLPLINSVVIQVEEKNIEKLRKIVSFKTVFQNTNISMQMNIARKVVNADRVQEKGFTGEGIGIAILDTGISPINDFLYPSNRIVAFKDFVNRKKYPYDDNGHGTHVSGIVGGSGFSSYGKYRGIATRCNIIALKVLNKEGKGNATDVLAGLQWVMDNKERFNIKIANLSIGTGNNSTNDPLVKAVEVLWDNGIVVTIAAGNEGPKKYSISSPAISKKVITVGSSDDSVTANIWGNKLINFSGRGPTLDCVIKPEVLAPGVNIISCLSKGISTKDIDVIDKDYCSLSGTSMSTPIVSGIIAMLLEKYQNLKPDDVKIMIKKCCKNLYLPKNQQGWGLIDAYKLLNQGVYYARK